MTFRELCGKEIIQVQKGVCLGQADDMELDPVTAQVQSLILLGRPKALGLGGREESLTIPWAEIEQIGVDAVLVRTALPDPAPERPPEGWWQRLLQKLRGG